MASVLLIASLTPGTVSDICHIFHRHLSNELINTNKAEHAAL